MNKEEIIEEKVKKAMDLFENIDQIEPDPFFYIKLNKKLIENKKKKLFKFFPIFTEIGLKPVLLFFLIIVNLISAVLLLSYKGTKIELEKDFNYYSTVFQSEYSINQNNYVVDISDNISLGDK